MCQAHGRSRLLHKVIVFDTGQAWSAGGQNKRIDPGHGGKMIPVSGVVAAVDGVDEKDAGGV